MSSKISSFLKQLERNNNRDWFHDHKAQYLEAKAEADTYFENWYQEMNSWDQVDSLKKFRIYRDVRFSKNKQPYKTHFSAGVSRVKPKYRGGYYMELTKDKLFLACGFWGPEKEDLLRIRKEIELDYKEFEDIVTDSELVAVWGDLQGDGVKTAPKGFSKEHPGIHYIRKKQFIFMQSLDFSENLNVGDISRMFEKTRPFLEYMSSVLTTDLNGESLL